MPMAGGSVSNNLEQRSFDTGASGDAQALFNLAASHLESQIDQRDADVKAAMANYQADGVSDEYAAKEQRWNQVAGEVRTIITILRSSLESNDGTAGQALQRAGSAVAAIG